MSMLIFALFFLSLFPLWVSILFVDIVSIWSNHSALITEWVGVIVISLILIASVLLVVVARFSWIEESEKRSFILVEAREEKTLTAEYLLSYILPLIAFDVTCWDGAVLFAFFFLVLSFLSIRHRIFVFSLAFEIFGYKAYVCKLEAESGGKPLHKIVISKNPLNVHLEECLNSRTLTNEYIIDFSKKLE